MDKKIKSLFTQMASDLPNETDSIGGNIEQIIPRLLEVRKRWRMSRFSTMIFLFLSCDRLHLASELDSFSDSPFLYPKGSTNHCGFQTVLTHNKLQLANIVYLTQVH